MATGLGVGGDVEQALSNVGVPSYVLDPMGVVRWLNAAAEELVGDVRGHHFTFVVAPEDSQRARELFSRKLLGTSSTNVSVQVLRLLEQGRSTKQIAAELHLSTETVRNHVRRFFKALGVNSRLEAVAAARTASPD
jgi:DNA-binding NarL/FixJ family response regulator